MRRRRAPLPDSLELLLDTICNAFGGILFIALLVIVMLRLSGGTPSEAGTSAGVQANLLELEAELEDSRRELAALAEAAEQQHELRGGLAPDEIVRLRRQRDAERSARDELAGRQAQAAQDLASAQQSDEAAHAELAKLDDALRKSGRELERLREEERRERRQRTVQIDAPRMRKSYKQELALFVKDHRIVLACTRPGEWNSAECELDLGRFGRPEHIGPKPGAGTRVDPKHPDLAAVKAALSPYAAAGPANYHLTIIIWEDSFDVFQVVKRVVKNEMGFEYRTLPMPASASSVGFGPSDSSVQ